MAVLIRVVFDRVLDLLQPCCPKDRSQDQEVLQALRSHYLRLPHLTAFVGNGTRAPTTCSDGTFGPLDRIPSTQCLAHHTANSSIFIEPGTPIRFPSQRPSPVPLEECCCKTFLSLRIVPILVLSLSSRPFPPFSNYSRRLTRIPQPKAVTATPKTRQPATRFNRLDQPFNQPAHLFLCRELFRRRQERKHKAEERGGEVGQVLAVGEGLCRSLRM